MPIPNPHAARSLDIAQKFISGRFQDSLAKIGLLNKMAMCLWGEPGTSKSVTVYQIIEFAIKNDWVVIDGSGSVPLIAAVMKNMRQVEPARGIVVVWEEFDRLIAEYEHEILQLLDGGDQMPNVLYVMTTNYVQNIPKRIFTRCRRIPFQVQFEYPGAEERRAYFDAKVPPEFKGQVDINDWVQKTEGFSIDHCAQVLVGVFAYQQTIDEVISDLRSRMAIYGDGTRMDAEPSQMAMQLSTMADTMEDVWGRARTPKLPIKLRQVAASLSKVGPRMKRASGIRSLYFPILLG